MPVAKEGPSMDGWVSGRREGGEWAAEIARGAVGAQRADIIAGSGGGMRVNEGCMNYRPRPRRFTFAALFFSTRCWFWIYGDFEAVFSKHVFSYYS